MSLGLFSYGTLEDLRVMKVVCGCYPHATPASLKHFARGKVVGANYPGIRYRRNSEVTGTYFSQITKTMWRRLDRYEGPLYKRIKARVQTKWGVKIAYAYQVTGTARKRLSRTAWDLSKFPPNLAQLLANVR